MKTLPLLLALFLPLGAFGQGIPDQTVKVAWDANSEPDLAGYRVYTRFPATDDDPAGPWVLLQEIPAGTETASVVGTFATAVESMVTAYNASGLESGPSNVITIGRPGTPTNYRITVTVVVETP